MPAMDTVAPTLAIPTSLADVHTGALKQYAATLVWALYDREQNQELFTLNVLFIHKTFRVADLRPLLERWFGPRPVTS